MPKMKTHKGVAKRVKITGTGKVMRRKPGSSHLKSPKTKKQLRDFRKDKQVSKAFSKHARGLLGI
jgi:large subunit ribosomal protein L35